MNTFHTFDPSVLVGFQNGTLVRSSWLTQSTWLCADPWWPTRHPRNLSKASATRIPSWMDSWDVCSLAKLRSSQITPINPGMSWIMWPCDSDWFCFLSEDFQKHVVFVWPRWFSYLISGLDLTIQIHLGSRLKSLAKQESSCRPLDSLWMPVA